MRSELMLEAFGTTEESWREAKAPPGWLVSESPRFVGRGVAALAADPERARWNQASVTVGELSRSYGFADLDGSRPACWRYMADEESGLEVDPADYR
jgi:hypothetical protein